MGTEQPEKFDLTATDTMKAYRLFLDNVSVRQIARILNREPSTISRLVQRENWESKRARARERTMAKIDIDVERERTERLLALREIVERAEDDILQNGLGLNPEDRLHGYLAALKQLSAMLGITPPVTPTNQTLIVGQNVQVNQNSGKTLEQLKADLAEYEAIEKRALEMKDAEVIEMKGEEDGEEKDSALPDSE